jgi:hypothetical protein
VGAVRSPAAVDVQCDAAVLRVALADGREISAPMQWFPAYATRRPINARIGD